MSSGNLLTRILSRIGLIQVRPQTRLTDEEAIAIARSNYGFDQTPLYVCDITEENDRILIHVRTATVGSWMIITIEDATGQIIRKTREGIR